MQIHLKCSCQNVIPLQQALVPPDLTCPKCSKPLSIPHPSEPVSGRNAGSSGAQAFWSFSNETSDNLIVVSANAIHVATQGQDELKQSVAFLSEDRPAEEAIETGRVYAFDAITKVECNLRGTMVRVTTKSGESTDLNPIGLHDSHSRDEFLAVLQRRLSEGWKVEIAHLTRLDAAGPPGLCILGLGAILGFIVFAANNSAPNPDHQRPRVVRGPMQMLVFLMYLCIGWTGLGCVVGLLLVISFIWLVKRVGNPPVEWQLEPISQPD